MRGWQVRPSQGYTLASESLVVGAAERASLMETPSTNRHPPAPDRERDASEEAIAWFARLRSEPVTAQDRAEFERWRSRSPLHARAFQEISALWDAPELLEAAIHSEGTGHPAGLSRRPRRNPLYRAGVAAAVLLVLTAALFQLDVALRLQADHVTSTGERRTITLADRSTVILNTNSAVAADYRADTRHVRLLKGEALFQVQPDTTRPFRVEHHGVTAQAVGTAFLVRERPHGVQITVVEGIVAVMSGRSSAPVATLAAGQRALVAPDGAVSLHTVDPDQAASWTRGRLIFDSTPFDEVLDEVARYHPGYIALWNPALARLRVSGSYTLADTNQILTALSQTLPVRMTRLTDRVVLFH